MNIFRDVAASKGADWLRAWLHCGLLALTLWGTPLFGQAQGEGESRIFGTVTDAAGQPLAASRVWLLPDSLACLSGAEG